MGIFGNDPLNSALTGFTGLFGNDGQSFEGNIINIEVNLIASFKDHPFKVLYDEKMQELIDSIKENGILTPVLVRKAPYDTYEMLSGHRRLFAAEKAGLTKIPARVLDLDDDDAKIFVVESNIQREEILPSEKGFAYKMKLEAVKRKVGRKESEPAKDDKHLFGTSSRDIIADEMGISSKQMFRYIRLTWLISPLLDKVDRKELPIVIGVEVSFLPRNVQEYIDDYLEDRYQLKKEDVVRLRNQPDIENLSEETVYDILNGILPEEELPDPAELETTEETNPEVHEETSSDESEEAAEPAESESEPAEQTLVRQIPSATEEAPFEAINPVTANTSVPYHKSKRPRLVHFVEERIDNYFPPTYSEEDIEKIIIMLLEAWKKTLGSK